MKNFRRCSARSPIFNFTRELFRTVGQANRLKAADSLEILERNRFNFSRRQFIKAAGSASLLTLSTSPLAACIHKVTKIASQPKIAIIGAGIAGLNAGYTLKKAGFYSKIFEAGSRVGGRMISGHDVVGQGLVTELGAEFIDSNHDEMLSLCREFGLELIDVTSPGEEHLRDAFVIGGRHYTNKEIVDEFRPLAARIESDLKSLEDEVNYLHPGGAKELDNISIPEYLDRIGAAGWLKELLRISFTTEYGLEASEQSALNFVFVVGTDLSDDQFKMYGESDERFKIKGGNDRITSALGENLKEQIELGYYLRSIKESASGYLMTFERSNGSFVDVSADAVIVTVPFSVLRDVELNLELPKVKRLAISSLGYGTNSKTFLGYNSRTWRHEKFNGNFFSDLEVQSGWDSSRLQSGTNGALTVYLGGKLGLDSGNESVTRQAARYSTELNSIFLRSKVAFNHKSSRIHWPSIALARGSYSAYRIGQWTSISGAEMLPVGNLYFAGEHCSPDFQGFMNGGAVTGKAAAENLLDQMNPLAKKERSGRQQVQQSIMYQSI